MLNCFDKIVGIHWTLHPIPHTDLNPNPNPNPRPNPNPNPNSDRLGESSERGCHETWKKIGTTVARLSEDIINKSPLYCHHYQYEYTWYVSHSLVSRLQGKAPWTVVSKLLSTYSCSKWRSISKPLRDSTWLSYRYSTCRCSGSSSSSSRAGKRSKGGDGLVCAHSWHANIVFPHLKLSVYSYFTPNIPYLLDEAWVLPRWNIGRTFIRQRICASVTYV